METELKNILKKIQQHITAVNTKTDTLQENMTFIKNGIQTQDNKIEIIESKL